MIMADPRNKVYHENCKITINGQNIIRVHVVYIPLITVMHYKECIW